MENIIKYDVDTALKKDVGLLPLKMLEWAEEVLLKQAELMKALAQVYVPVDTGSLRDSIRVERGEIGESWRRIRVRAGGYVVNPKTGRFVNYAVIVEYKQPYMRPAWEDIKTTIDEMITKTVIEGINSE